MRTSICAARCHILACTHTHASLSLYLSLSLSLSLSARASATPFPAQFLRHLSFNPSARFFRSCVFPLAPPILRFPLPRRWCLRPCVLRRFGGVLRRFGGVSEPSVPRSSGSSGLTPRESNLTRLFSDHCAVSGDAFHSPARTLAARSRNQRAHAHGDCLVGS